MRCIIKTRECLANSDTPVSANIEADRLEFDENQEYIRAYNGNNLVGVFDVGSVLLCYLAGGNK